MWVGLPVYTCQAEPHAHSCNEVLMWVHSMPEEQAAAAEQNSFLSKVLSSLCDSSYSVETEKLTKVKICICAAFIGFG